MAAHFVATLEQRCHIFLVKQFMNESGSPPEPHRHGAVQGCAPKCVRASDTLACPSRGRKRLQRQNAGAANLGGFPPARG